MSLNIEKKFSDVNTIVLSGRLDTVTAPQLEAELEKILSDSDALVLDMANLEYISSAGLRVILKAQKAMNTKGIQDGNNRGRIAKVALSQNGGQANAQDRPISCIICAEIFMGEYR